MWMLKKTNIKGLKNLNLFSKSVTILSPIKEIDVNDIFKKKLLRGYGIFFFFYKYKVYKHIKENKRPSGLEGHLRILAHR